VNADTARLFKDGFVAERRPLMTVTNRAFRSLEYVLLALVLGSTGAGPDVMSLRKLVERVRSAAVEVEIALDESPSTRRAMVCVLQWMISLGLALELHDCVEAYAGDEAADAILKIRPEHPAGTHCASAIAGAGGRRRRTGSAARFERRMATRQWMRSRLVEDPVR
jgi:hypothetical protein